MTDLIPTWPQGFDAWEGITATFALFVLKSVRPTVMYRRASYVDRLGWSILLFDVVFALTAALSLFLVLYPGVLTSVWVLRIPTAALAITALWQVVEVLTAPPVRIETAMSGPANGYESQPGGYSGGDRRAPGVPGRRAEDYTVRGMDPGPGQERR